MKKFTKLFLSSALVAAMALTSVVAFADDDPQTEFPVSGTELKGASYSTETGLLTVPAEVLDGRDAGSQATFLVYEKTSGAVTQEKIVGIDQSDSTFKSNGLKGKPQLPAENEDAKVYTVKVGYYKSGTFTVLSGDLKISNGGDILLGDVNFDSRINLSDATAIVNHAMEVEGKELTGDALVAANVNDDSRINLSDATCIVNYAMETETGYGHVGETK